MGLKFKLTIENESGIKAKCKKNDEDPVDLPTEVTLENNHVLSLWREPSSDSLLIITVPAGSCSYSFSIDKNKDLTWKLKPVLKKSSSWKKIFKFFKSLISKMIFTEGDPVNVEIGGVRP